MRVADLKVFCFIALLTTPIAVNAAETAYFQGKTVTLQVGAPAGGRQDRIARTLTKYLAKYTPGSPTFLIQNKTGGQGIPAMLALSKGATDGSFMSMVISSYLEAPYFGAPGATYDPRTFVYVGAPSTGKQRNVLFFISARVSRLWTSCASAKSRLAPKGSATAVTFTPG